MTGFMVICTKIFVPFCSKSPKKAADRADRPPRQRGVDKELDLYPVMPVLRHLLQLIVDELNLGSDDDLAGSLGGADDTGSAGFLTTFSSTAV